MFPPPFASAIHRRAVAGGAMTRLGYHDTADINLRLAIEASPTGMLMVNRAGTIVMVNAQIEKLFGYSRVELLGQPIEMLVPERFRALHPEFRQTFANGPKTRPMGHGRELFGLRKDGSEIPIEIGLNPLRTPDGDFVLSSVVDVTERMRANRERENLLEQLRALNASLEERVEERTAELTTMLSEREVLLQEARDRAKQLELADRLASLGTMAAGVAHEINNPLTAVVMNATMLAEDFVAARKAAGDEQPDWSGMLAAVTDIRLAAGRIRRIVADLRGFARPEAAISEPVDIVRCVEWSLRITAHEFQHRARVTSRFSAVAPVQGDEARLGQVFVNLLVNAAHAIEPGAADQNEVAVTISQSERDTVIVEVSDTGHGIPAENLRRVFEPFFTTKAVGVGTGLGLSICHGIVRSLGGTLEVESRVGEGTLFRVTLPVAATRSPGAVKGESNQGAPTLRGRILVVDDEDIVLRGLQRALRGHEVVVAASGREALELIGQSESFDLIISDLMMPTMTGMELHDAVLERDPGLARRIVFISGGALSPRIDDFLARVPNVRIEKPIDVRGLERLVQSQLRRLDAQDAVAPREASDDSTLGDTT